MPSDGYKKSGLDDVIFLILISSLTPVGQGPKIVVVLLSVACANKMKLFCKVDQREFILWPRN